MEPRRGDGGSTGGAAAQRRALGSRGEAAAAAADGPDTDLELRLGQDVVGGPDASTTDIAARRYQALVVRTGTGEVVRSVWRRFSEFVEFRERLAESHRAETGNVGVPEAEYGCV